MAGTRFDELSLKRGLKAKYLDHRYTLELFKVAPVATENDGTAASGATGATNVMSLGRNHFEYHIKGAGQTLLVPTLADAGLLSSLDLTDNEGAEYTQGITARSPGAFTIGTDGPFFLSVKFTLADVSGTDDCAVGFKKANQAYQANFDDLTDGAFLNVILGDINIETMLNNAATTTTDTTLNWADTETHTLTVKVSRAGVVTYEVDGVVPPTVAAFTFDSTDVVVPAFFFLHATTTPGAMHLVRWECGLGSRSTTPLV